MSDQLPFGGYRPRPIPAGMLDRVVRAGRRRRRNFLAGASGTACLTVGLVVALAGGPAGTSSLQPAGPPSASPTESPSAPDETRTPDPEQPSPSAIEPTAGPSVTVEPTATGEPAAEPSASPTERPLAPWHRALAVGDRAQADRPSGGQGGSMACNDGRQVVTEDSWCVDLTVYDDDPAHPDAPLSVVAALCRPSSADSDGTVTYDTEQEIEVAVRDQRGDLLWTWSTGTTFEQTAHSRAVTKGRCRTWTLTWNGTDDAGTALERGSYAMSVTLFGSTPRGPLVDRFPLDFEVMAG
jgi:hypothetical protein